MLKTRKEFFENKLRLTKEDSFLTGEEYFGESHKNYTE
jgi:hypothetical protein